MNKKAFTLFFVLILVFILSLLAIRVYELKSFSSINISKQYNYLQAKNHLAFLKEYLNHINLENIEKIEIENNKFNIFAHIKKEAKTYEIKLYVSSKFYNVSLHEITLKNRN